MGKGGEKEVEVAGTGRACLRAPPMEVIWGRITRNICSLFRTTYPGARARTGEGIKCLFEVL